MANVHDVAAYLLQEAGQLTTMKLQKLLYYSQGWSLAWDGVPLFNEELQAWANGPVAPAVFRQHRGEFTVSEWPHGDATALNTDEQETVDAVLDAYGPLTGQQLADKSHTERPWLDARGDTAPGEASKAKLDLAVMQDYFGGLDQLGDE